MIFNIGLTHLGSEASKFSYFENHDLVTESIPYKLDLFLQFLINITHNPNMKCELLRNLDY